MNFSPSLYFFAFWCRSKLFISFQNCYLSLENKPLWLAMSRNCLQNAIICQQLHSSTIEQSPVHENIIVGTLFNCDPECEEHMETVLYPTCVNLVLSLNNHICYVFMLPNSNSRITYSKEDMLRIIIILYLVFWEEWT